MEKQLRYNKRATTLKKGEHVMESGNSKLHLSDEQVDFLVRLSDMGGSFLIGDYGYRYFSDYFASSKSVWDQGVAYALVDMHLITVQHEYPLSADISPIKLTPQGVGWVNRHRAQENKTGTIYKCKVCGSYPSITVHKDNRWGDEWDAECSNPECRMVPGAVVEISDFAYSEQEAIEKWNEECGVDSEFDHEKASEPVFEEDVTLEKDLSSLDFLGDTGIAIMSKVNEIIDITNETMSSISNALIRGMQESNEEFGDKHAELSARVDVLADSQETTIACLEGILKLLEAMNESYVPDPHRLVFWSFLQRGRL